MTRNFRNLDIYLNELLQDVYPQPPDAGHTGMMRDILSKWIPQLPSVKTVLDVGCGETCEAGKIIQLLNKDIQYTGVTFGNESVTAQASGFTVFNMDMNFLEFTDGSFDLVFARHVAEHSPMPLLSLFEWARVCKDFLCLIVPSPNFYARAGGQNHYYVLYDDQWEALAVRAGFHKIWTDVSNSSEYRFMFEKKK